MAEKGHKLVSVDYSQIELRLAADMADIAALREAFREGKDIHAMTASQVFGVPVEGMDPMVRRRAKAINFGIIYGISAFGLAAQLGIPQAEARDYIGAYFARYPGIREYMERTKKYAREHGYVETLFGRRCHVPGINDKNPAKRSYMERASINAPLQGTAADIIKRAMIRIPPALQERGLEGADAAPGARRAGVRSARRGDRGALDRRPRHHGKGARAGAQALGAADLRSRRRHELGGGALSHVAQSWPCLFGFDSLSHSELAHR